ncbi:MAG: Crp/Fnr family transcriptional regulator [Lewinellaceae bacterium]|nr:Crp/Fnr family transcriptional regulator [Lewinellaceae bacterium]
MNEGEQQRVLKQALSPLHAGLRQEILDKGIMQDFEPGVNLIREGQYIKVVPLVLSGLIKVVSSFEERELLLYYIEPAQSCIMSFVAIMENAPSQIHAHTEATTTALLLPADAVREWVRKYPSFNELFFHQFRLRYNDLLDTIRQLLFGKLDQRLLQYLQEKSRLQDNVALDLRHWQIAADLGSSREVITRLLKKLEKDGDLRQTARGIELID